MISFRFIYAKTKQQITPVKRKPTRRGQRGSLCFYLCSARKHRGRFAERTAVCQKPSLSVWVTTARDLERPQLCCCWLNSRRGEKTACHRKGGRTEEFAGCFPNRFPRNEAINEVSRSAFLRTSICYVIVSAESLMNHEMQHFYDYFFASNPDISKYTAY